MMRKPEFWPGLLIEKKITTVRTSRSDLEKTTIFQIATVLCMISSLITQTSKSKHDMRQTAFLATRSAA